MNIDVEKIKADLERLNKTNVEDLYETNKELIKKDYIEQMKNNIQTDINVLTVILNNLPSFEIKEDKQEELYEEKQTEEIVDQPVEQITQ